MMKRALVVGTGDIAKRHIKNLQVLVPNIEVLCVSSTGRSFLPSEVGATVSLTSVSEAIALKPEMAIIGSPSTLHLQHASETVLANIPTLIEKPLCSDYSELENFRSLNNKKKIMIGYNFRFSRAANCVKDFISKGKLGNIYTVFSEVGQYLPNWRPSKDYSKTVSAKQSLGGGALLEMSHEIDYLIWFFGMFEKTSAVMSRRGNLNIDVEDNVDALLLSKSGLVVHLHLDFLQHSKTRSFKAIGEYGEIIWDLVRNEVKSHNKNGEWRVLYSANEEERNSMYLEELAAFLDFCEGKKFSGANFDSGREVMLTIAAIRRASKNGSWEKIDGGLL